MKKFEEQQHEKRVVHMTKKEPQLYWQDTARTKR